MAKEGKKVDKFTSTEGCVRDRVIFHETEEIPKEGIFLSLNGVSFQVKPGEEVDIPQPVRAMVDQLYYEDVLPGGKDGETFTRKRKRYPYTLIQEAVNVKKTVDETQCNIPGV